MQQHLYQGQDKLRTERETKVGLLVSTVNEKCSPIFPSAGQCLRNIYDTKKTAPAFWSGSYLVSGALPVNF